MHRFAHIVSPARGSVQPLEATRFPLQLFLVTFDGGGGLALAHGGRLFVKLTATYFREYTGFFTGPLESSQRDIERLVFFDSNVGHKTLKLGKKGGEFYPLLHQVAKLE